MEDLRIRRLVLNEVGVFKHLDVSFPECPVQGKAEIHIFVGENGTGKTTLLHVMTFFEGWHGRTNNGDGVARNRWRVEPKMNQASSSFRVFLGSHEVFKPLGSNSGGSFQYSGELHDFFEHRYFNQYWANFNTPYLFFAYNANRFLQTAYVKPGRQFVDTRLLEEGIAWDKEQINEALFQWVMDSNVKALYASSRNDLEEARKLEAGLQKINEAISDILGRPVGFVIDEQRLRVRVNVQDEMVDAEQLALGYQSLIGWLADLIYRLSQFPESLNARFTLFLDEIDIHLHPKAQRKILPAIQKLFPNAQIFITTHSPFVIGSVDDAWVYKFKLDADGKSVLDGAPIRSEDGNSYEYVLSKHFDIKEQFGIDVERELDAFYALKKNLRAESDEVAWNAFVEKGRSIGKQTSELEQIISIELKQAARRLNRELSPAL